MKIVALTDIHGAYRKAEEIIRKESPDMVIMGGDLTTRGTPEEAEKAVRSFTLLCPSLLCVAGNMDLPSHEEVFVNLGVSINGRGVRVGDLGIFGVSASPPSPLHTPYEISEGEIARRIKKGHSDIKGSRVTVFVSHSPPFGTALDVIHTGIHVGSMAVREFVEREKPSIVVCGHIHEARGRDTIGPSILINCGSAAMGQYGLVEIREHPNVENRAI
jgi:Icc-related predicted phosphoesterase